MKTLTISMSSKISVKVDLGFLINFCLFLGLYGSVCNLFALWVAYIESRFPNVPY